jgi:hypothetical protein
MKTYHNIEKVTFDGDALLLKVDGREYRFALADVSSRLLAASPTERAKFEISPSGYGIHWPSLDEDLSIDGLLGVTHTPSFFREKAA